MAKDDKKPAADTVQTAPAAVSDAAAKPEGSSVAAAPAAPAAIPAGLPF